MSKYFIMTMQQLRRSSVFATPFGVATHSLRSAGLFHAKTCKTSSENKNAICHIDCKWFLLFEW